MLSFGNGIASGCLSRHRLPRIHAVELVEGQIKAARLYERENRGILRYPGFTITNEDGRNYLLRTDERFDIITTDATHPVNTSSWALFTREFYLLVRKRLADDGVFMQWLPFHNMAESDYRDIIKTFESVFPYASLWYTSGSHTSLVATPHPLTREDVRALTSRVFERGVQDDLADMLPLTKTFLLDHSDLRDYVSGARVVTDDNAYFMPNVNDLEAIARSLAKYQEPE
jgi:spermidine synthase